MAEKIEDIAKSIERHCEKELAKQIPNRAYGRSYVKYNEIEKALWLTNRPNHGGYRNVTDMTGATTGTTPGNETTLKEDGDPIYKNSPLGALLIQFTQGVHAYNTPRGPIKIEIINSAKYNPDVEALATDLTIQLSHEERTHVFRTLRHLLVEIRRIDESLTALREQEEIVKSEAERSEILNQIGKKEQERKAKFDKAQTFIRKYAELRYQPIPDAVQDRIKRSEIFQKTMIINGGPGTGKTTTLIQRIKFLLDLSKVRGSLEDFERNSYITSLDEQQQRRLTGDLSWTFFSPSELLKQFLQNAMVQEGLDASSDRVKVWEDYKKELIRNYKLVNTDTQRPFLFYRGDQRESALLPTQSESLSHFFRAFSEFHVSFHLDKLKRVADLQLEGFEWKNLGISIQQYIGRAGSEVDIDGLLRLLHNLNLNYKTELGQVTAPLVSEVRKIAGTWLIRIKKDDTLAKAVQEYLRKRKSNDSEEEELESEDFEETPSQENEFDVTLLNRLRTIIRKQALSKFDKETRLTPDDKQLLELLPELADLPEYDKLGQLAYCKKYFERICNGVVPNVYRELPMVYKRFRRANAMNRELYTDLIQDIVKDDNKRLHENESAFLLYVINDLIAVSRKVMPTLYSEEGHQYIKALKHASRNIIAVDEATDFHLIDLLAMRSLRDLEISSLTLSGDLMQRMTNHGLTSWNSIAAFTETAEGFVKEDLLISYRQSPSLLDVAKAIYKQANGEEIAFEPFVTKDDSEPAPLRFQSRDDVAKIEWISERIFEIYRAYAGSIPSIAIFAKDDEVVLELEKKFRRIDRLSDVGIEVKACIRGEVLGRESAVRIFDVQHIKGLEFEAVFFYDIDELDAELELLYKYLYVALSRATFYLGVTHVQPFANATDCLNTLLIENKDWVI